MEYSDDDDYSEEIDLILNTDPVFDHKTVYSKTWIPVSYRRDAEIKSVESKLEEEQNQVAMLKRKIKELQVKNLFFVIKYPLY